MKAFVQILLLLVLRICNLYSQEEINTDDTLSKRNISKKSEELFKNFDDKPRGKSSIRVVFYNVENLFDTENDPLKNDDEFTPEGVRHWTPQRYNAKLKSTYKTLVALGGWEAPEIIGFCEVENRKVLYDLCNETSLRKWNYQIIHEESGDRRGIDVALIYRPDKFKVYSHNALNIKFKSDTSYRTRDVLLVSGVLQNKDTLHVFVNHWPSKFGGAKETEDKRMDVAKLVRSKADSLFKKNSNVKIVIMGDFNDEPFEPSIVEGLKAQTPSSEEPPKPHSLYNLMSLIKDGGTHKFQTHWSIIDQFIVSSGLLISQNKTHTNPENAHIFKPDFLVVPDETNLGDKPNRTFNGFQYNGGFSDHLPIYLDILTR